VQLVEYLALRSALGVEIQAVRRLCICDCVSGETAAEPDEVPGASFGVRCQICARAYCLADCFDALPRRPYIVALPRRTKRPVSKPCASRIPAVSWLEITHPGSNSLVLCFVWVARPPPNALSNLTTLVRTSRSRRCSWPCSTTTSSTVA
jgi:hypothetical protein